MIVWKEILILNSDRVFQSRYRKFENLLLGEQRLDFLLRKRLAIFYAWPSFLGQLENLVNFIEPSNLERSMIDLRWFFHHTTKCCLVITINEEDKTRIIKRKFYLLLWSSRQSMYDSILNSWCVLGFEMK